MATKTFGPTPVIECTIPIFSSHSQTDTQLQLTTNNLRNLGATLKTLNVPSQTPRVSPSPSDSSSDSESNHRIHRSTKQVCVREDMNTTREISPRPSKPAAIAIPSSRSVRKAKWIKPDTPAPWHTSIHSGAQEGREDYNPDQESASNRNAANFNFKLNGMSFSPLKTPIFIQRKRNSLNSPISAIPFKTRLFCGNGIGIRRCSHLALPRPRSLAKSCSLRLKGSLRISRPVVSPTERPKIGDMDSLTPCIQSAEEASLSASIEFTPSLKFRDSAPGMIDALADMNYYPTRHHPVTTSSLSDHLRQPRTYVDHVRSQRLPPNALQSKTTVAEAQGGVSIARQRSASV